MSKDNKQLKRFTIYIYVELISAILFALLSVSFHADISLTAFPLSVIFTAITIYFTYFKMMKNTDGSKSFAVLKFIQYLPIVDFLAFILRRAGNTGTTMFYDIVTVFLWLVVFFVSLILSYYMSDKRMPSFTGSWKIKPKKMQLHGGARFAFEIVDWIDALVQAVFMVLLIQIFFVQLYVIPSESMVPNLIVKDRLAVSKVNCGPKFPLTEIGFPDIAKYERGDIVVLRNPHYKMDRKSEVKSVTSQLVYMLTIMTVDLNKDENGNPKYDPLVKRICGEPGEQLVMQDGTLYRRNKNSDVFTPVDADNKYACWDLTKIPKDLLPKVQYFPLSMVENKNNRKGTLLNLKQVYPSAVEQYTELLKFEELRRNYDLDVAAFQAKELCAKFENLAYNENLNGNFTQKSLKEIDLFLNLQDITFRLMSQNGGVDWFEDFMTSWIPAKNEIRDIYSESNYKLNVMCKIYFGNLVVRFAELIRDGMTSVSVNDDVILTENMENASTLDWYVRILLDQRNMPVFPADDENGNPKYIPDNCYFMMGDNRFNSHDLRHANDPVLTQLTKYDPLSVEYDSMMEPQYIHKKLILGKPMFRFWPLDRPMKLNQ